jgi:hypothetical protein
LAVENFGRSNLASDAALGLSNLAPWCRHRHLGR